MIDMKKVAMILAEFIGTAVLTMAMYAMVARSSFPFFSALAAGGTAGVMVFIIGAASGAHINPAVTFGLWTLRKIQTAPAIVAIAAQFLGGLAAWALIKYFLGQSIASMAGEFEWKIFVAEMVGALVFTFGVASAVYQGFDNGKLAATVGLSLAGGIMVASLASNAIINPAVAVGIQSWNWAYALGPLAGGLLGMNIYGMVFANARIKIGKKKK